MGGALVVPVDDVDGGIGPGEQVDRPEPSVAGVDQRAAVPAGEGRAVALEHVPVDGVRQQVAPDERAAERRRKGVALVDDPAGRDVAAVLGPAVSDRAEVAVGVRVVQRAVLGEALDVIAALYHVKRDVGAVAAAEGVAGRSKSRPQVLPPPSAKTSNRRSRG